MSMFATMAGFYLFVKQPDKQGCFFFPREAMRLDPSTASARARNLSTSAVSRTSPTTTCGARSQRTWRASACVLKSQKSCSTMSAAAWAGSLASTSVTNLWRRCGKLFAATRYGSREFSLLLTPRVGLDSDRQRILVRSSKLCQLRSTLPALALSVGFKTGPGIVPRDGSPRAPVRAEPRRRGS